MHPDDDNRSVLSVQTDSSYSSNSSKSGRFIDNRGLLDDDPQLAMQDMLQMSGGGSASHTLGSLPHHVYSQVPILPELTNLHLPTTGRRVKESIAEVAADLNKDLVQAILEVTYAQGLNARDKLFTASNLFTNLTKTHRSLRYAIICYIWTHHEKSKVKTTVASIIQDYALASSDTEIKALLEACSNGHTCNFMLSSSLITVDQLPGVQRLKINISMSTQEFEYATSQWLILWQCMCNFICQHDFSKPKISLLDEWLMQFDISKGGRASQTEIENHPFCTKDVTVQVNHSKMHKALLQIEAAAHQDQQISRVPTNDALKKNLGLLVHTAHKSTWARLLHLIDAHDLNVDTMLYRDFTTWVFRASCQMSARSKVLAYVLSFTAVPVSAPPENQPRPLTHTPDATPSDKQGTAEKPIYIQQGPYRFEGLVGPGVMATASDRKKADDTGGCSNCLLFKYRKYGQHTTLTCPYTTPNCVPWPISHIPLTVVNGIQEYQYRASDPTAVQKFIDDRKILLSKAGTCTPSQAVPPIRNVIFQPVQIEEINDQDTEDTDESAISTPSEPPAKGTLRAPTWHNSPGKNLRTHFMMFHINSGLLHWGD